MQVAWLGPAVEQLVGAVGRSLVVSMETTRTASYGGEEVEEPRAALMRMSVARHGYATQRSSSRPSDLRHPPFNLSRGLSTYEKEYLAILLAVEQWCSYLQHSEFIIKTDKKSLIHMDDQRITTPWQQEALTKLLGLNYKILYKKGTENSVADALSRVSHAQTSDLAAILVAQPA